MPGPAEGGHNRFMSLADGHGKGGRRSQRWREIGFFASAGVLLTLATVVLGILAGPVSRSVARGRWPGILTPRQSEWGLVKPEGIFATWSIDRSEWWMRTEVIAHRMQVSGMNLSLSAKDFEARRRELSTLPEWLRPGPLTDHQMVEVAIAVGFPFRAFAARTGWIKQLNSFITWDARGGVLLAGTTPSTPDILPLSPVWTGLVLDVACWGLGAWGIAAGARSLRSASRRRRNLCERCGYPRAPGPCPECGHVRSA